MPNFADGIYVLTNCAHRNNAAIASANARAAVCGVLPGPTGNDYTTEYERVSSTIARI